MTLYMNFRQQRVGGGVVDPIFLEGDGTVAAPNLKLVPNERIGGRLAQRDVLFATHGFNVSFSEGACSLGTLEGALDLPSNCQYVAVLWPGDSWLPVINYPFEGSSAIDCGKRLAKFCNRSLASAASLSFITHSLGARLALEAAKNLNRKARAFCLTAAAINRDCLSAQYASAFANVSVVSVLASRRDMVLKLAYPIGDPIADILGFDHRLFTPALGYAGPPNAIGATVPPWQIPDADGYNHGDYLPPSAPGAPPNPNARWTKPASFMRRTFMGSAQTWP